MSTNARIGMDATALTQAVHDHLACSKLKTQDSATLADIYEAVAHATRDRIAARWLKTRQGYEAADVKRCYYLSAEFLLGRALTNNLIALDIYEVCRDTLAGLDIDLDTLVAEERDPGLGNGGLGRLAACFLDSMASLALPGMGYGIRYEYGIFEQHIIDGRQVERGDDWLRQGNPWEVPCYEDTAVVNFYGHLVEGTDDHGNYRVQWVNTHQVLGVPYDMPVVGYQNDTVNTLRLWSARAAKEFNFELFNSGDYRRAVEAKALTESISKVLYPNDQSPEGRELRLKQQYFFVACSIHDLIQRYKANHDTFDEFSEQIAIQLNDTHPAITVAELMRVLVDVERLTWDAAWAITEQTVAYTNHTLLPEALERWPVPMFRRLLPRHLSIIFEINRRFLRQIHVRYPNDLARQRRMSIIEEGTPQHVRMAHLAVIGSHSVNGVAALHSELIKSHLLPEFAELWPKRFNNKTNGVTPRRWLRAANPALSAAISQRIGKGWIRDLEQLSQLDGLASDAGFRSELRGIKRANKQTLAQIILARNGITVDPGSIFDVQIKRIHEYKRQLLNCLHVIALYIQLKDDPTLDMVPRTFIFGGKAAPGYVVAKQHIKLINDIADIINNDPAVGDRLKVIFLANYSVSLAERIIPASDISEQISMAGKEASGTGNMKFAMNGALTVGTLDGANIEIREAVGAKNFFLFGLDAIEVRSLKAAGYQPQSYIDRSPLLTRVINLLDGGFFSPDDPARFNPIVDSLRYRDEYLICADFDAYVACQATAEKAYRDAEGWSEKVIHNIANSGRFSSDRTIQQYADEIWGISAHPSVEAKRIGVVSTDVSGPEWTAIQ